MPVYAIPFETHQTDTSVWIGWWKQGQRPPLTLRVHNLAGDVVQDVPLTATWSSIGLNGIGRHQTVCQYQVVTLQGLEPGTTYGLRVFRTDPDHPETRGVVETIPDRLPSRVSDELSERPFTILLGSCYSAPDDPDRKVDDTYLRLWRSRRYRPHLKILCGDQVYLDQPAGPNTPMVGRMSSVELRLWMIAKYGRTWAQLLQTLQRGANYMTSDDHEFWNDYPERPIFWAWPALHLHEQYRRDWSNEARAHFREIQQGAAVTRLDIGNELSIFIADTRVNRQRDRVHFMSVTDFKTMTDWVRSLETPGVLVLGQPLLALPLSTRKIGASRITTDRNLPYFHQYDELVDTINAFCRHDLLVLGGDVHFGRIASFHVYRNPDVYPTVIHEVISSAMAVLSTARGHFEIGPQGKGIPALFPPARDGLPTSRGNPVRYEKVVPRMEDDDDGTENHFMTVEFTRHPTGRGLQVSIRAWLTHRPPSGDLPASPWTYTCSLDANRPASAFMMIAPPVVDFEAVGTNTVASRDRSLTLSSVGPVPVVINDVRLEGPQAATFRVTPHPPHGLPVTLQPGESFPISVEFQSSTVGEHKAHLVVNGTDPVSIPVSVQANLVAAVIAPDMDVLPRAVNFGLVELGKEIVRNIIVTNYGSAPLRFQVDSPAPEDPFAWIGDRPNSWRSLPPGGDEIIPIRYIPVTAGQHKTSIIVRSDEETISIPLYGEAMPPPEPRIRTIPTQLNFRLCQVGSTTTREVTLANDGAAMLTIAATSIEGRDSTLFVLRHPRPAAIQPGQSARLAVALTAVATATVEYRATLTIESNAGNQPMLAVDLFGVGAEADLWVTPTEIVFNPSPLASELHPGLGAERGFNIYNQGTARIKLGGRSFRVLDPTTRQESPHFTIVDITGQRRPQDDLQLDPGEYESLAVQFHPTATGTHTANIEIIPTGQPHAAMTVIVSGRGVQ